MDKGNPLSIKLKNWRTGRPGEREMDEFIRDAAELEGLVTDYLTELSNLYEEFDRLKASNKKKTINYIVTTQGWSGKKVTECETEDEAWKALNNCSFGSLSNVSSPSGKSVSQFTPF